MPFFSPAFTSNVGDLGSSLGRSLSEAPAPPTSPDLGEEAEKKATPVLLRRDSQTNPHELKPILHDKQHQYPNPKTMASVFAIGAGAAVAAFLVRLSPCRFSTVRFGHAFRNGTPQETLFGIACD